MLCALGTKGFCVGQMRNVNILLHQFVDQMGEWERAIDCRHFDSASNAKEMFVPFTVSDGNIRNWHVEYIN